MATPRILIADKMELDAFDALRERGVTLDVRTGLDAASFASAIRGARVLIVRSARVTKEAIDAADELGLIVRAGSGVNTIDVKSANRRGIYVANCPGKNSVAVAELAMGLMLALDRRIPDNVIDLRRGTWNKGEFSKARGLEGQRLGLVGFGSIARAVALRARAFGMVVSAHARTLTDAEAESHGVERAASLEEIFATSDIVSLHVPLTNETRGMVDRRRLESMRPGAMLINTARAEIVDEDALLEVAKQKGLRVGADVFRGEPEGKTGTISNMLAAQTFVYGTHHIGASTDQAQSAIAAATASIVATYLETGEVPSAVNIALRPPVEGTLIVRHLDRVGVLAAVLSVLKRDAINVETMHNVVFADGEAACARMQLARRPSDTAFAELRGIENVLNVQFA